MHQTAGLAACLTLLLGASASAQITFLSNDGFAHDDNPIGLIAGRSQFAQPFRSGELSAEEVEANTSWLVTEVRVRLNFDNTRLVPQAKLCERLRGVAEGCRDLRGPTSASSGEQIIRYTHSGYPLGSRATRFLVLYWGGQGDEDAVLVPTTYTTSSRSSVGWDLPDRLEIRHPLSLGHGHRFDPVTGVDALGIEIRGRKGRTPLTPDNPNAPAAAEITGVALGSAPGRRDRSGVCSSMDRVYGLGDRIEYKLTYDKAVRVSGSPSVRIRVGFELGETGEREARYTRVGSTDTELVFAYTVSADDPVDERGPELISDSLALNSGQITTLPGEGEAAVAVPAETNHGGVGRDSRYRIDSSRAGPWADTLSVISTPMRVDDSVSYYGRGDEIKFELTMGEAVSVRGTPALQFYLGSEGLRSVRRQANYVSAPGRSMNLEFAHRVQENDADEDGIEMIPWSAGGVEVEVGGPVDLTYVRCGPGSGIVSGSTHKVNGALGSPNEPGDTEPPVVADSQAGAMIVVIAFDEDLEERQRVAPGSFVINSLRSFENDDEPAVTGVRVCGRNVVLELGITLTGDDENIVSYAPGAGRIQDLVGNTIGPFDLAPAWRPGTRSPCGGGGGGGGGTDPPGGSPGQTVPGAPTNLLLEGGDGQVTLTWDAPEDDGGSEITDYEYRINGQGSWISIGSTDTTTTVTGLDNDTVYTFEVRAVNRTGRSRASNRAEPTPEAPEVFTLDFAHFANGTGITSEMVFVNVAPHPIRPALYFYDQQGHLIDPESVVEVTGDLEVTENGSLTVRTEMEPLGELTISTHGQGELVSGSVKVLSDGPIGGGVRYGVPEIGVAGVGASPPVRDALFPARRQAGGIRTAAALHNLGAEAMGVSCRLMSGGVALEEVEIPLEANGQTSWFIEEAFTTTDTSDFLGSVRCTAPGRGRFTAIAVEMDAAQRIFNTLSVVPVDRTGGGGGETVLDFAHFANGTWITDLVFLNLSTEASRPAPTPFHTDILPSRPAIYFYDTEGNPIAAASVVDITGDLEITEDGALTVQTEMEPLGVLTISTHGRGELVSGSARVVSEGPIGGMLRFEHPALGVAGVGASPPVSDALFPVRRQEGGITTGVALHNLESSPGLLRCDLMREGVLLDAASIPLEANGQTSWLIDQAFPAADTSDFAGSVRCDAVGEGLFSAVALEMDPGNRIFTTLPVVPVED